MMRISKKRYRCEDCFTYFVTEQDDPTCPTCERMARVRVPVARSDLPSPAILSEPTKRQTHVAETIMQEMGMTDMRDGQRAGDIAAPPLTASQKAMLAPVGGSMFQPVMNIPAAVAGHESGNISYKQQGLPKDHAMRVMQNVARKAEGV